MKKEAGEITTGEWPTLDQSQLDRPKRRGGKPRAGWSLGKFRGGKPGAGWSLGKFRGGKPGRIQGDGASRPAHTIMSGRDARLLEGAP